MTEWIRPTTKTTRTTDSFAAHVARGSGLPGLDYATPIGEGIMAMKSGVVTRAGLTPSANGKNIRIAHDDGTTSYYLHFSALYVVVGQRVNQGNVIGLSGNTGRTTGPHLHVSIANKSGVLVDPATLIDHNPPTPSPVKRTIKIGSRGAEVVYLQQRLGIRADGIFGPLTRNAVIRFQRGARLVADGIVGPKTWAAIG